MGKQSSPRRVADNEARAVLRNLRVSPQKLNLVAAMIRGLDANKALSALSFSRRESHVLLIPTRRPIGLTF